MIILQNVTYIHINGDLLFSDINLVVNKQNKIALIGNNGKGKSTLLTILAGKTTLIRMILGKLVPKSGTIDRAGVKSVWINSRLINNFLLMFYYSNFL